MKEIFKQPAVLFITTLVLLFTILFPQSEGAAAGLKFNWIKDFKGLPLFQPISQKDGSTVYGNYNIIKDVYYADIMSLDGKGKQKKVWKLKEQQIDFGGTEKSPIVYSINKTKGSVKAYNTTGKNLWSYELKQKIRRYYDYYQMDETGNIYFILKDSIYKISSKGKLVYKVKRLKEDSNDYSEFVFGKDGSLYIKNNSGSDYSQSSLTRYTTTGKLSWTSHFLEEDPDASIMTNSYIQQVGNLIYILASFYDEAGDQTYKYKLYALDKNGEIKWVTEESNNIVSLEEYQNKTIVLTSKDYYQIDLNGNVQDQVEDITTYDPSSAANNSINNGLVDPNGDMYILLDHSMIKIDSTGNKVWETKFTKYAYRVMYQVNDKVVLQNLDSNGQLEVYKSDGKKIDNLNLGIKDYYAYTISGDKYKNNLYITSFKYIEKTNSYASKLYSVRQ